MFNASKIATEIKVSSKQYLFVAPDQSRHCSVTCASESPIRCVKKNACVNALAILVFVRTIVHAMPTVMVDVHVLMKVKGLILKFIVQSGNRMTVNPS